MYGRSDAAALTGSVRKLDRPTDLLSLHRYAPERYPFLLQSTAPNPGLARFDILFATTGESIVLEQVGALETAGGFLGALDAGWRAERTGSPGGDLPFYGGWFLYLGYELSAEIEPSLTARSDAWLPAAFAARCPAAIVTEHENGQQFIVCEPESAGFGDVIESDAAALDGNIAGRVGEISIRNVIEEDPEHFLDAVVAAKRHIADGDIYQANLSREWRVSSGIAVEGGNLYQALRRTNPAPFAGLARWGDTTIVSSSPERLLSVRGNVASTRPIAGTRPRSDDKDADLDLAGELFANPKERAEHVMLIDLERNDLGRICEPGTVEVNEMMALESYAHVHHIVSNVQGALRKGVSPGEAIRAMFPGGTITGCPKVRCMQIIAELERVARGAYTGTFGYLDRSGNLDLNILIRTMVMRDTDIRFRAGSGIVADSDPSAELAETRAKALGLLRALSI